MTQCIRSCTVRGKHTEECPVVDHEDGAWVTMTDPDSISHARYLLTGGEVKDLRENQYGGIELWHECRGCKPRDARHGQLCTTCHNRLERWLDVDGPRSLVWLHRWLDENTSRTGTTAAKQDWQRPGGNDGPPLPIRENVFDQKWLVMDRVKVLEDQVRDEFDLSVPDRRFTLAGGVRFLAAWLEKVEDIDLVQHLYEQLDDLFRTAAKICPWDLRPRRLPVPCPHCDIEALVVFNGSKDVDCRNCHAVIDEKRYGIWVHMLRDEVA